MKAQIMVVIAYYFLLLFIPRLSLTDLLLCWYHVCFHAGSVYISKFEVWVTPFQSSLMMLQSSNAHYFGVSEGRHMII